MLVVCVPKVVIHGDGWGAFVFDCQRCSCVLLCACVCRFKTPPCVDSKLLRVCRQNARVLGDTGVLLAHTEAF